MPESLFKRNIQKYEQERVDRLQAAETLERRIKSMKQETDNASTWAKLMKRYTELETLDSETLLLLIDKIIVNETQIIDGRRKCEIQIVYNYVGDIDRLGLGEILSYREACAETPALEVEEPEKAVS